ncbi:unnamed protein product [Cochlearia groenlandica]
MTTLQRSADSFRRQGSSGRTWTDHRIIIDQNHIGQQSSNKFTDDYIRIRKSTSSSTSSTSSSTRIKPPGCGLSSFFRHCIGSPAHS